MVDTETTNHRNLSPGKDLDHRAQGLRAMKGVVRNIGQGHDREQGIVTLTTDEVAHVAETDTEDRHYTHSNLLCHNNHLIIRLCI